LILALLPIVSAQTLSFKNFSKIVDSPGGDLGDIYRFPSVLLGVDAIIEITDVIGNSSLIQIDEAQGSLSNQDYSAFRPQIRAQSSTNPSGVRHSMVFDITFISSTSGASLMLANFDMDIFDTDGDNDQPNSEDGDLREFALVDTNPNLTLQSFGNRVENFTNSGLPNPSGREGVIAETSVTNPGIDDDARYLSNYGIATIDVIQIELGATGTDDTLSLDNDRLYGVYFRGDIPPTVIPEPTSSALLGFFSCIALMRRTRKQ